MRADHPVAWIDAKHSGDMYHVRAVMALFPEVYGLVLHTQGNVDKANAIAAYLAAGGRAARVRLGPTNLADYTVFKLNDARGLLNRNCGLIPAGTYFLETGATSFISAKMARPAERNASALALAEGMAGGGAAEDAILADLRHADRGNFGDLQQARPLVLVNYRSSGQGQGGVHPALDTGETGMSQLLNAAAARFPDATIIPVGEYIPNDWPAGPSLCRYWIWPSAAGGRGPEAEILRCLRRNYNVRVVIGMRSGVMDLFAFLGFKVVSIDRAGERGLKRARNKTQAGLTATWFRVVAMTRERDGERLNKKGNGAAHWPGTINANDLTGIMDAAAALYVLPAPLHAPNVPATAAAATAIGPAPAAPTAPAAPPAPPVRERTRRAASARQRS